VTCLATDVMSNHFSEALAASEKWLSSGATRWLQSLGDRSSKIYPRRLKALCEIGFLEYRASRHSSDRVRAALRPSLAALWRSGELLTLFRYNIVHANLFLPLCAATVAAIGVTADAWEDMLSVTRLAARHRKERLPFRTLDLLHGLYAVTGDEQYLRRAVDIAGYGCLGPVAYPHDVDVHDEYAVTHTIFYVTDFGRRDWPPSLASKQQVSAILDILSARAERENNLDLIGEYVLGRQMLDLREGRYFAEIDFLSRSSGKGYWSGPADLAEALKDVTCGEERSFFEHYHTTIVVREALNRHRGAL
jgi:hypothetical protein